jgi:glycosyltransferase involved in cell wall biosynthesis
VRGCGVKPRIALLTTSLDSGGAETQVVSLAVELARRGYKAAVISLTVPSAYIAELSSEGVEVFTLRMSPGLADPRGLWRLIRFLVRFRPQVLHSHLFHANILARVARLFVPVPVVISTLHSASESGRRRAGTRARDFAYRGSGWLADRVVAVCEAVAARHIACKAAQRAKLRVIPNGVDCRVFRPDRERRAAIRGELRVGNAFVWLAAGRLMWKKDYPTMLRAFAPLSGSGSVLVVAGTGPQAAELHDMAAAMNLNVRWLGARSDVAALMNAADGLVLSSLVEGLPMVLLEAAASGLVAVSTNAGGASEAISEGDTGFVVPVGDVEALSGAMARVQSLDANRRESMSQAARARALALYDLQAVTDAWEGCYRDLLEHVSQTQDGPPWT